MVIISFCFLDKVSYFCSDSIMLYKAPLVQIKEFPLNQSIFREDNLTAGVLLYFVTIRKGDMVIVPGTIETQIN